MRRGAKGRSRVTDSWGGGRGEGEGERGRREETNPSTNSSSSAAYITQAVVLCYVLHVFLGGDISINVGGWGEGRVTCMG